MEKYKQCKNFEGETHERKIPKIPEKQKNTANVCTFSPYKKRPDTICF